MTSARPRLKLNWGKLVFVDVHLYRRSSSVRGSDIRGTIEMPKILMGWFPIPGCELIRKDFRPNTVDGTREVMVGNRCVSSLKSHSITRKVWKSFPEFRGMPDLYSPKRLTQSPDSCRRIENNFCIVESEHGPIQRMVTPEANVDGNFTIRGLQKNIFRDENSIQCVFKIDPLTWKTGWPRVDSM